MHYAAVTVTAQATEGLEKGVESYLERIEPPWELVTVSHTAFPLPGAAGEPPEIRYSALIVTARPREDA